MPLLRRHRVVHEGSPLAGKWSPGAVIPAIIRDGATVRDRLWLAAYFLSRVRVRARRPFARLAPRARAVRFRTASMPLWCTVEAGGISAWYEVAMQRSYAPVTEFLPRPGWTVVDVGANIGTYSVWVSSRMPGGRLLSIEPNPIAFRQLSRTLATTTLQATQLSLACGETESAGTLHFRSGYTVNGTLSPGDDEAEAVPVRIRRLDRILDEQAVDHVDLLKIDVEGVELEVLRGAPLDRIDRIVLEAFGSDSIRNLLIDAGFTLEHRSSGQWSQPGLEVLAFRRVQAGAAAV